MTVVRDGELQSFVAIRALKEIDVGEEVTFNYGIEPPFEVSSF